MHRRSNIYATVATLLAVARIVPGAALAEPANTLIGWGIHGQTSVPQPNADSVAISAGNEHSSGLRSDGTIVAWGRDDQGQCGASYGQCDVPPPWARICRRTWYDRHEGRLAGRHAG